MGNGLNGFYKDIIQEAATVRGSIGNPNMALIILYGDTCPEEVINRTLSAIRGHHPLDGVVTRFMGRRHFDSFKESGFLPQGTYHIDMDWLYERAVNSKGP